MRGDTFEAPVIVNAAGAWCDEIATLAGLSALGFEPKIPLAKGLKPMIQWYVKNAHLRPTAPPEPEPEPIVEEENS